MSRLSIGEVRSLYGQAVLHLLAPHVVRSLNRAERRAVGYRRKPRVPVRTVTKTVAYRNVWRQVERFARGA